MPAISVVLQNEGWHQGVGPNFFFPQAYPHVHVGIDNAAALVNNLAEIRGHIAFITLSYGGHPAPVPLYQLNPPNQDLANNHYDEALKLAFEVALHNTIGIEIAMGMQQRLNELTGMGIDL